MHSNITGNPKAEVLHQKEKYKNIFSQYIEIFESISLLTESEKLLQKNSFLFPCIHFLQSIEAKDQGTKNYLQKFESDRKIGIEGLKELDQIINCLQTEVETAHLADIGRQNQPTDDEVIEFSKNIIEQSSNLNEIDLCHAAIRFFMTYTQMFHSDKLKALQDYLHGKAKLDATTLHDNEKNQIKMIIAIYNDHKEAKKYFASIINKITKVDGDTKALFKINQERLMNIFLQKYNQLHLDQFAIENLKPFFGSQRIHHLSNAFVSQFLGQYQILIKEWRYKKLPFKNIGIDIDLDQEEITHLLRYKTIADYFFGKNTLDILFKEKKATTYKLQWVVIIILSILLVYLINKYINLNSF